MRKAVFMQYETTCTEGFVKLLHKVRANFIGSSQEWIWMVADGAMAHRSNVAKAKMEELRIHYLQTVSYTPESNSIERLWNYLKKEVTKELLVRRTDQNIDAFKGIIKAACDSVDYERQRRAALLNNHRYLQSLLEP